MESQITKIKSSLKDLQDIALEYDNELQDETRVEIFRKTIHIWRILKELSS